MGTLTIFFDAAGAAGFLASQEPDTLPAWSNPTTVEFRYEC